MRKIVTVVDIMCIKKKKKKINNVLVTVDQEKKKWFWSLPQECVLSNSKKKLLKKNLLHTYYKKKVKMCNTYIPIAKFSLFVKLKKEKKSPLSVHLDYGTCQINDI